MPDDWRRDRDRFGFDRERGGGRRFGVYGRGDVRGAYEDDRGGGLGGREDGGSRRGSGRSGADFAPDDYYAGFYGADQGYQPGSTGEHRGRGPRGYVRSDERVREDVSDRLTDDPHIDASDIEVSVSGREVTLSGTVSSRFAKRHAEDIAESVSGVTHVQNNLRIKDRSRDEAVGGAEMATYGVSATSGTTGTSGGSGRSSGFGSPSPARRRARTTA